MEKRGLNEVFCITPDEFARRTGIEISFCYEQVVPPRQIKFVKDLAVMKKKDLVALIGSIPLIKDHSVRPYDKCEVQFCDIDPKRLNVPQTFLLDRKLLFFLNGFGDFLGDFCCNSLSKLHAHYIFGNDMCGVPSVALYLPPIIERREREDLLIDGNHRSCICGRAGTTISSVVIRNPSIEPPYTGIPWHTHIVAEKPPYYERYVNFNPALLKDFNYVGIDG